MKTLLFLHGWGGGRESFSRIAPFFAPRFNCLFPEFPTQPPSGRPWTLDDYVAQAERELAAVKCDKFSIIAHSFGARVAVLLALKYPERTEQMVLTGAAGIKPRFRLSVFLKIKFYKLRKKLFGSARGGSNDYRKLTPAGKETFRNIIGRDLRNEIRRVNVPTLLIWGGRDKTTPHYMAKMWTTLQKGSTLITYQDSGHFCFNDAPARFTTDTFNFLEDK